MVCIEEFEKDWGTFFCDGTLECSMDFALLFYPFCPIIQYYAPVECCFFVTRISRNLPLQNVSSLTSYIKISLYPKQRLYENLVVAGNHVAIDFYSIDDLTISKRVKQREQLGNCSADRQEWLNVERIFVITGRHLYERHEHLQKVLRRQSIDDQPVEWRWWWNQTMCNSEDGQNEVIEKWTY